MKISNTLAQKLWLLAVYSVAFIGLMLATVRCAEYHNIPVMGPVGATGPQGNPGSDGSAGVAGHSMVFNTSLASASDCPAGGTLLLLAVDTNDNGLLDLTDGNLSSANVCNGQNGSNGLDGQNGADAPPTPFTPVGLIDPCGDAPGRFDEVFIKLSSGTVLASFSDAASGLNTRFSVLTAGSYVTTDGDNCAFAINSSGDITYENHHY